MHRGNSSRLHHLQPPEVRSDGLTAHHASTACIFLRSMSIFSASLQVNEEFEGTIPDEENSSPKGWQTPHCSALGLLWLLKSCA